ncbi:chemotaxis protein MotB [Arboricoccus pini]|uniref:Chemotaxis protein MotB n=1 Tax=Arboricoccus pini TaxID=1963835 RepID=A0A212QPJ9_9PROT|nr:flagellar motor protein MotB [Arboricoccus pini]SNB61350.1 chemotaxis protein MotB [Arboricoccus pini]
MAARNDRRIIIIKRGGSHGGHHGSSAWKIAYADFVTAMMAFFLLLWLITSANKATLQGLSEYFTDAAVSGHPMSNSIMDDQSTDGPPNIIKRSPLGLIIERPMPPPDRPENPDANDYMAIADSRASPMSDANLRQELQERETLDFQRTQAAILKSVEEDPQLASFSDNLLFSQSPEGLEVQIIDRDNAPMFPLGSDVMYPLAGKLLGVVAKAITKLPNAISIRGHTDDRPYGAGSGYDNWRLSSDRANAARIAMVQQGLSPERVADVIGKAAGQPLADTLPDNPRNRRLSIILLREQNN